MKSAKMKYLLVCSFLSLCSTLTKAQVDPCISIFKDANQKYDDGWYDEAIVILNQSITACPLTKTEKIKTHKLLMSCYLAIDKIEEAEQSAAAIMKLKPSYEADKLQDPVEVIAIFQKYKPTEYLRFLFLAGLNNTRVIPTNIYSILASSNPEDLKNYKSKLGVQFGFNLEYRITKSLWVQTGFHSRSISYSNTLANIQSRSVYYVEDLSFIDVPLETKYYFGHKRLNPFAKVGLQTSFLTRAQGELSRDDVVDLVNRKSQRNAVMLGYNIGAGISLSIKSINIQIGLYYLNYFRDFNKEGTRYQNLDLAFKYYYLDNDFTISNTQLNLGIAFNLAYKNVLSQNASK